MLVAAGQRRLVRSPVTVVRRRAQAQTRTGEKSGISWSIEDVARGVSVRIETSEAFQVLVHYSPPSPTVISPVLETLLPNGFNLAARGQPSGLIELEPGATWRAWARIAFGRG